MFIRLKKIKNNHYAYLVENTWKKRKQSSRQQVKAYLGRVLSIPQQKKIQELNLAQHNYQEAVRSLLKTQLLANGFTEKNNKLHYQDITVDLVHNKITKDGKDVVLKIHDGYLCNHSLRKALHFKGEGYEEQVGLQLAETIVGLGLDLPQELFIQLFEKIYHHPEEET